MEYQPEKPGDPDKISQANLRRARTTAIMFAAITLVALLSLVYAFVQKGESEQKIKAAQATADSLRTRLQQCSAEAEMQKRLSEDAARMAQKMMEEADKALAKSKEK